MPVLGIPVMCSISILQTLMGLPKKPVFCLGMQNTTAPHARTQWRKRND
jgi:hypothetical protein